LENYKLLFIWFFISLHILFKFKYIFASITPLVNPFSLTLFYLASIPILIYLSKQLIAHAKELNKKLSFLFFAEKTQSKFIFLITAILYSTAILIPLRQAFLQYADINTKLPNVILAAYSLILVISILLFFSKEDVLTLIPTKGKFFAFLKEKIEKYYYPVFIFFMGLLILANPYIGYSNLAWYLLITAPASAFILYGMFLVHSYIRKYAMKFFLKEEDDEIRDKFDHAKTYYALFVIMSFFILLFFTFIIIARMWRFDYNITSTWQALSETWVLPIDDPKLGIVQILILIAFITSGFLISSLLHKFVFNKLFDIFRTEPGTQNTIFRITHYIIIAFTSTLGFVTIKLGGFIFVVGSALGIGLGLALKDLVADLVAGFLVLIERPLEIGNFVQLDENTMGTVHKISARATTIRTARNFAVIVPNRDIISKQITNWDHARRAVGFELNILVAYSSDTTLVQDLILQVLHNHPSILKVPTVTLRLESFEENGIQFFVRAFISSRKLRDQWTIASEIRLGIMDVFRKHNIVIPFPQRVVRFSNAKKNGQAQGIEIKFDKENN
jgi:small-conductance mechanosensitive channel